jgi:hypothetical protein
MNATEQARLQPLYASMLRALKLQGVAEKTVDAHARAVRRTAAFFDRCPDDLSAEDLRVYFAKLLETHSWSTIKLDRCGFQFSGFVAQPVHPVQPRLRRSDRGRQRAQHAEPWSDRSRLDFSNFRACVDAQSWGRYVCTAGYGETRTAEAVANGNVTYGPRYPRDSYRDLRRPRRLD